MNNVVKPFNFMTHLTLCPTVTKAVWKIHIKKHMLLLHANLFLLCDVHFLNWIYMYLRPKKKMYVVPVTMVKRDVGIEFFIFLNFLFWIRGFCR